MEPRTSAYGGRRAWPAIALLLAVLLSGPENAAKVTTLITSIITWPLTREIRFEGNRFEIFNVQLLMVYLVAAVGLNLLKHCGLLSAGVSAVYGFGGYAVAIATLTWGWSFWLAWPFAAALGAALGFVLGLPALRLGVFTFAMVTLGYAFVFVDLAGEWRDLTGGFAGLAGVQMPEPFSTLEDYYWLVAATAAASVVIAHNWLRSPLGRAALAVANNPFAARSVGISAYRTQLLGFAVSSAFGAAAGGLYAPLLGSISPDAFTAHLAVLLILMVILGGVGSVWGPVLGTLILFRLPLEAQRVTQEAGEWSLLGYGAVLLLSVQLFPHGLMSGWRRLPTLGRKRAAALGDANRASIEDLLRIGAVDDGQEILLDVEQVHLALGGVKALQGVDLEVRRGQVHALIGPNGSGKTTLMNVVSGYLAPDSGTVRLFGELAGAEPAEVRARRGLGRTFQTPAIFQDMTCLENTMTALDHRRDSNGLAHVLRLPRARRDERQRFGDALTILATLGLAHRATDAASALTPGERRLLELARVVAIQPRIALLDEPAAGLSSGEIDELADIVRRLKASNIAVLLVDHHVDFVLGIADVVTVLDHGIVIAHGPPEDVAENPDVIAAYFGDVGSDSEGSVEIRQAIVDGEMAAVAEAADVAATESEVVR